MSEEAFIYEAIRTPRGKQRNGALNEVKPLNLVVGLVDERECGGEILSARRPGGVWFGCAGSDLFSAQALPPAERKHEGPHPAGVLQAAG